MSDYFFVATDARGRLAGSKVTIEYLVKALENAYDRGENIWADIALNMAVEELKLIDEILDKNITENVDG